jgi:hypothetical protein
MIGVQILALLFVIWMTYFSYLHYRRREFSLYEFLFWQIMWVGLTIIVLLPKSVNFVLKTFSISRTFDFVVISGIVILFGITFRNYVLLKRTERKIEDLTRRITRQ